MEEREDEREELSGGEGGGEWWRGSKRVEEREKESRGEWRTGRWDRGKLL